MRLHVVDRAPKTLGETAVCFAFTAMLLVAAAVGIQWMMHLLP